MRETLEVVEKPKPFPESKPFPETKSFHQGSEPSQQALIGAIANLEKTVERKDQALLDSATAATNLQRQLDEVTSQNERLQTRLTAGAKANEALVSKAKNAGQDPDSGERLISETELLRLKEQWRASQKLLEKEQDRLRSELVKASAGWQQSNHQLEIQTRGQRTEADRSLSKIAALQQQLASADANAATQAGRNANRKMWIKLSGASALTAVLMVSATFWVQFSPSSLAALNRAEASVAHVFSVAEATPPASSATPGELINSAPAPHGQFGQSLSRLNDSLSRSGSASAEQLLRAVRKANAKTDPGVCNVQWNNGQPALNFGGGGSLSLESSLDRCATAVDKFLKK